MTMRRLILALLLMQSAAPAAIRDIVTRLRHAQEDGTNVLPAVSADLTALQHELRDLIADTVQRRGSFAGRAAGAHDRAVGARGRAVRQWKFKPGVQSLGKIVEVVFQN
jgi:hypothetical protein